MNSVVTKLPSSGFARTNHDTAELLRELADHIEEGRYGHVDTVVAVVEHEGELTRNTYGGPTDRARVVGLLTMAIHRASCGAIPED